VGATGIDRHDGDYGLIASGDYGLIASRHGPSRSHHRSRPAPPCHATLAMAVRRSSFPRPTTPPIATDVRSGARGGRRGLGGRSCPITSISFSRPRVKTARVKRSRACIGVMRAWSHSRPKRACHHNPKSRRSPVSGGLRIMHFHGHDAGSFTPWRSPGG
jgi:hypothetical protein